MRRLACRQVQRALDRMADGRLAGGEAEEVQAHLDACEQCEREHAGFLRLRAALADQPRVEMRADALERLQARLAATGRPAGSARLALAGLGLGALIGLAAALPYLMRPTGEPETPVVGAAPVRPSAAAAEHRVSEPMAPGPAAGLRPGEVRHARAPAANKGQSSFRPAGAARKGTVPGGMGGEAPARGLGAGSAIVIVVTPPEPRCEASVVLRMAGIDGPDGTPEATVTMVETRGEDWFSTFLPERDHVAIRRVFLQTIDNLPTSGTVNCIVTADGRDIPIRWLNRPLKDGQGNVVGVLCIGLEPPPSPGGS